jgi:hypothetical protein
MVPSALLLNVNAEPVYIRLRLYIVYLLSRAKNSGRQCHFKIWLDCHKFKKKSPSDYTHVNSVKKIRKKNTIIYVSQ